MNLDEAVMVAALFVARRVGGRVEDAADQLRGRPGFRLSDSPGSPLQLRTIDEVVEELS